MKPIFGMTEVTNIKVSDIEVSDIEASDIGVSDTELNDIDVTENEVTNHKVADTENDLLKFVCHSSEFLKKFMVKYGNPLIFILVRLKLLMCKRI